MLQGQSAAGQVNARGSDQNLPAARLQTKKITGKMESSFLQDPNIDTGVYNKGMNNKEQQPVRLTSSDRNCFSPPLLWQHKKSDISFLCASHIHNCSSSDKKAKYTQSVLKNPQIILTYSPA